MKVKNTNHYTPPGLARRVAEAGILPLLRCGHYPAMVRVYDPACGDGALLVAALDVLSEAAAASGIGEWLCGSWRKGPSVSVTEAREALGTSNLAGSDIDGDAVARAGERFNAIGINPELRECDSLFANFNASPLWARGDRPNCILMNPPYLGGAKISGAMGKEYCRSLVELHPGSHGNADLAAHFLRLASRVAYEHGPATIGFVATNTIAQGDTRETGLLHLITDDNWDVRCASDSEAWPGRASVSVRVVGLSRAIPLGYKEPRFWASSRLRRVPRYDGDIDYNPMVLTDWSPPAEESVLDDTHRLNRETAIRRKLNNELEVTL